MPQVQFNKNKNNPMAKKQMEFFFYYYFFVIKMILGTVKYIERSGSCKRDPQRGLWYRPWSKLEEDD